MTEVTPFIDDTNIIFENIFIQKNMRARYTPGISQKERKKKELSQADE